MRFRHHKKIVEISPIVCKWMARSQSQPFWFPELLLRSKRGVRQVRVGIAEDLLFQRPKLRTR